MFTFIWKPPESSNVVWWNDPAFDDDAGTPGGRIPPAAMLKWQETFDADVLAPYVRPGETPQKIVYRSLNAEEAMRCEGLQKQNPGYAGVEAACQEAFRCCVDFPEAPLFIERGSQKIPRLLATGLHPDFMRGLIADRRLRSLVSDLGWHILKAAMPTVAEKKASSPPSTPAPSSSSTAPPSSTGSTPADASGAASTSAKTDSGD